VPLLSIGFSFLLLTSFWANAQETLTFLCNEQAKLTQIRSRVSYSNDKKWRAYVDVKARGDLGCVHTTELWVGPADGPYRIAFVIPPESYAYGNGMKILGWEKSGSVLLARTDQWQEGSDALDTEGVLAIDASSGLVYTPDLSAMMAGRLKNDRCYMRILDAALGPSRGVNIIVRAQFKTFIDFDERKEDITPASNCNDTKETWSFDFDNGRIRQLSERESVPADLAK
jgi:hypothetical protein